MGQNQKSESLPRTTENNFTISVKESSLSEIIAWMLIRLKIDFTTIENTGDGFYRINCIGGREDHLTLNGMFFSSIKH